jgi:hypothetical protein
MDILPGLTGKLAMYQWRLAVGDRIADDGIKISHGFKTCDRQEREGICEIVNNTCRRTGKPA